LPSWSTRKTAVSAQSAPGPTGLEGG
jgi:hypothetical protein